MKLWNSRTFQEQILKKLTISRIFHKALTIQEQFKEFKEFKNHWSPCFPFLLTLFRFKRTNRSGIIYDVMNWLGKFADLILGISHKLCCITLSPADEWGAIAPACADTHQYLFRCAIIAHAIISMRSQSHYNTSTSVSVILLKRCTSVVFTCFCLPSFGRLQRKLFM